MVCKNSVPTSQWTHCVSFANTRRLVLFVERTLKRCAGLEVAERKSSWYSPCSRVTTVRTVHQLLHKYSVFYPHSVCSCFVWHQSSLLASLTLVSLCNVDALCLLWGGNWTYKYSLDWCEASKHRRGPGSSPCESMWDVVEKVALAQVFLPVLQFFSVSIILRVLHTDICLNSAVIRRTSKKSGSCSTKQCLLFRMSGSGLLQLNCRTL